MVGMDARFAQPAIHIDLQADLQWWQMRRPLVTEPLCNFQPVNGVYPVEMFGHQPAFVALDGSDAMPFQGQVA